jgi:hypothetical protein
MEVLNPLMNRIPEFLEMGKPINASEFPLQQADPNNLMIGTTLGTGSGILNNPPPLGGIQDARFRPPEEGIMQLHGGTISQITQPNLTGKLFSEGELAPGIKTVNPIVNNPYGTDPNAITSVAEQQGLNITNTDGLNKFVNNMINNRLKEFFSGIMSMLDV